MGLPRGMTGDTMKAGDLPTAYFFAGGRVRWLWLKLEAYSLFLVSRFCWTGVAIVAVFQLIWRLVKGSSWP